MKSIFHAKSSLYPLNDEIPHLTAPPGGRYTSGMVRRADLLSGAEIRHVAEKGKSYLFCYITSAN